VNHVIKYPFCLAKGEYGLPPGFKWECGVRLENYGSDGGNVRAVSDGEGSMVLTEIGRYKPGKYPERVFYIRTRRAARQKEFLAESERGGALVASKPLHQFEWVVES
jgi:hypothetical protein